MSEPTRVSEVRTASYEARPEDVRRVCLLYSGGLDTSVMLKWIQDEYDAEVVTLTVNLGQPGEDYEVVTGKARDLGAIDAVVVELDGRQHERPRQADRDDDRDLWLRRHGYVTRRYGKRQIDDTPDDVIADLLLVLR